MTDVAIGRFFKSLDHSFSSNNLDDTVISDITSTTYILGSPVVSCTFTAPTSGRVRVVVGGGFRDNGASLDRVFLSPQIVKQGSSEITALAASVTQYGYGSSDTNALPQYGSRAGIYSGLTPGYTYVARAYYLIDPGTDPDTADISSRDITIIPVP